MTAVIPPRAWHITHAQQMLFELMVVYLILQVADFIFNSDSLFLRPALLWTLLCRDVPIVPALLSTSKCTHLPVILGDPENNGIDLLMN